MTHIPTLVPGAASTCAPSQSTSAGGRSRSRRGGAPARTCTPPQPIALAGPGRTPQEQRQRRAPPTPRTDAAGPATPASVTATHGAPAPCAWVRRELSLIQQLHQPSLGSTASCAVAPGHLHYHRHMHCAAAHAAAASDPTAHSARGAPLPSGYGAPPGSHAPSRHGQSSELFLIVSGIDWLLGLRLLGKLA